MINAQLKNFLRGWAALLAESQQADEALGSFSSGLVSRGGRGGLIKPRQAEKAEASVQAMT